MEKKIELVSAESMHSCEMTPLRTLFFLFQASLVAYK